MPYVVTKGKRFHYPDSGVGGVQIESRFAVATLEEARELSVEIVRSNFDAHDPFGNTEPPLMDDAYGIPEVGGTIGPLPDGTVIEVRKSAN
jgi:hypothetical protein